MCCLLMLLVQLSCQKIIKVSSCPSLKRARNQNQVILVAQKFSALYKMRFCCCLILPYLLTAYASATTTIATPSWVWVSRRKTLSVSFCWLLTCGKKLYMIEALLSLLTFIKSLIRMLILRQGKWVLTANATIHWQNGYVSNQATNYCISWYTMGLFH